MTALEYPISLGYLAVDPAAGYPPTKPHRGVDFAAPSGTPIVIGDTTIGLTGMTGLADGPHVHVQAGRDESAQKTIDPTPYIGKPGTVVKVGSADQWGNYVCVKVNDVYVYYCHMSKQLVAVGTVIKGGDVKPTEQQVYETFRRFAGKEPKNPAQVEYYVNRDIRDLYKDILGETVPTDAEVSDAFATLYPDAPADPNRTNFYTNHPARQLYRDIAGALTEKLSKAPAASTPQPAEPAPLDKEAVIDYLNSNLK